MAKFIRHPIFKEEPRINLDFVKYYTDGEIRASYTINFYFDHENRLTWDFNKKEHRDKCLKEIDDLLLTNNK